MDTLFDLINTENKQCKILKTSEVMEYLDIRKHKLNKLIKDGEIGVHKNEKSRNEFSRAEI